MAGALASPKRLQLITLLCQCERRVEALAEHAGISLKLASAHLKVLRDAGLVESRKQGKYVLYRLTSANVAGLWVSLRALAEERIADVQVAMRSVVEGRGVLRGVDRETILRKARRGDVIIIDVRPQEEFAAGHLPFARSIPLTQLRKKLKDVPSDIPVVAYCRGPFCMMAAQAVELLRQRGISAYELEDGVAEWKARGLPLRLGR